MGGLDREKDKAEPVRAPERVLEFVRQGLDRLRSDQHGGHAVPVAELGPPARRRIGLGEDVAQLALVAFAEQDLEQTQ
jgi:hypothetical protein